MSGNSYLDRVSERAPGTSSRVVANFDPPDFWEGSDLERFATRAEEATDSFVAAVNTYIEADATYQRVRGAAYGRRRIGGENHSASERMADLDAMDEMIARRSAENLMEAQKSLMRTRLAVLSAAQTHARGVQAQT